MSSAKEVAEAYDLIERIALAGWRLQKIAGGADIKSGDMQMRCKEGMFSEEIAGRQIKALLRRIKDLEAENQKLIEGKEK